MIIALYYQTKIPISFWCRRGLNPRSLIQPSKTLPVQVLSSLFSFQVFLTPTIIIVIIIIIIIQYYKSIRINIELRKQIHAADTNKTIKESQQILKFWYQWVPFSSTNKVSDGCIRDLEFNPRLHQKLIGVLV